MAPDGSSITLYAATGGSGVNFTNTCFTESATTLIVNGNAPFTGNFLGEENMGWFNNNVNANGVWSLCINDDTPLDAGVLNNWSITFGTNPAPFPVAGCGTNAAASHFCQSATPVCNLSGYCGNTSDAYAPPFVWPELEATFCGGIQNNSFIKFVASSATATFNINVTTSSTGQGIQVMVYSGGCGSGAITSYGCNLQIPVGLTVFNANGLIAGNTYYIMIDGIFGAVCDYSITATSGVNLLNINPTAPAICNAGAGVSLTASGGNGTYTWSPALGLSATSGATVTANPTTTSTYTVTSGAIGALNCPLTKNVVVTVAAAPTIVAPSTVCVGSTSALTPATGGTWVSSNTAVATVTNAGIITGVSAGSATFTFTNTATNCTKTSNSVTVNPKPVLTAPASVCIGSTGNLTPTTGGTWTSSNTAVATVTNAGVITGLSAGNATFTFTSTTTGCSNTTSAVAVGAGILPTITCGLSSNNSVTFNWNNVIGATGYNVSFTINGGTPINNGTLTTNTLVVNGLPLNTPVTITVTPIGIGGCFGSNSATCTTLGCAVLPAVTAPTSICVGSTGTLTPTTGGTWVSSNTAVATVANAGVVTAVAAGNATFTFTNTATTCSNTTSSVLINALPVVTAPANICVGNTGTLSPSTGGTWTSSNTAVATVTNAGVITGVSAGNATFSFTNTTSSCSKTTSSVTINALPVVTAPANICVGSTGTLSPTSGGTWTSSNTAVATVTNAGIVTPVSAGIVTFTFTNSTTNCSITTSSISTLASLTPIISCGTATNSSVTFNWNIVIPANTYIVTYTVNGGAPINAGTINTNTYAVTGLPINATVVITVTPLGNGGCFASSNASCIACANPINPTFTIPTSICSGNAAPVLPTTSNNGVTGTWSPTTVNNTSGGTYVFTPSAGQCANAYNLLVTVNPLVVPMFTPIGPLCNQPIILPTLPVTSTNGITGIWNPPSINNTTTTTYTFTPTAGLCASSTQMIVTVNQPVTPTFTLPTSICNGSTAPILPTTSNNSITGTWNPTTVSNTVGGSYTFTPTAGLCANPVTISIAVNIVATPTFTIPTSICSGSTAPLLPTTSSNGVTGTWSPTTVSNITGGTYVFTPTAGQCASTFNANIAITALPLVVSPNSICVGNNSLLNPTTAGTWVTGNAAIATVTNPGVITGLSAGNVTFTYTNTASGCSKTTNSVNVVAKPIVTAPTAVCIGSTGQLSPSTGGTWASSNIAIAAVTNAGIITGISAGNVTFTFTNTTSGCTNTTSNVLIGGATIIPTFTPIAPFCSGGIAPILPTTSLNGITGTWNPSVVSNTTSGLYSFTPNPSQCATTPLPTAIVVIPKPVVNIGADRNICENTTTILDATNPNPLTTYLWQDGSTNATYTVSQPGTYTVVATVGICSTSKTVIIGLDLLPRFTISGKTEICPGDIIILSTIANSPYTYLWQNGATSPSISVNSAGNYFVDATNLCGTIRKSFTIDDGVCRIFMPNAFTPNGDTKNDTYKPSGGSTVSNFTMELFNRWGQKVFTSNDANIGWDGTFENINAVQGTYVYHVMYKSNTTGRDVKLTGTFILIR